MMVAFLANIFRAVQPRVFIALLLSALALCSCKTREVVREVPVEVISERLSVQRDSIYLRDSVQVLQYLRGDTVVIESAKWRTRYVERLRVDTAYVEKPVTVATTEVKEVARPMRWWQKGLMACGVLLWLALLAYLYKRIKG